MSEGRRYERERRTIEAMIGIYCRDRHREGSGRRCAECAEVLTYAESRLDKCVFPESKPTCANCPVHCYKPAMRARVKEIMRYAGPRMAYRRPLLALRHYFEGRKDRSRDLRQRRPSTPAPRPDSEADPSA